MIRRYALPIAFIVAVSMLLSFASCSKHKNQQELCRVIWVIDGDTIMVNYQGHQERVRLLGINAPEQKQYGYKQAAKAITSLIGGRSVRLEFEEPGRRDVYGRIFAYIFVNGTNINVEMVRAGWSRFWTKYGAGKYADQFKQAEDEARELKRGLWKK